jgi:K+-transporting ATPase ATPase A chain
VSAMGWFQLALYLVALLVLVKPLGAYIAHVYAGTATRAQRVLGPLERFVYRAAGVRPAAEMEWKAYALALLAFNAAGFAAVYLLQRVQGLLPLNPQHFGAVAPDLAFNTAVSFVTNTNWQSYGGETTLSNLTQMVALTVQNFVSAATGMAVLVALVRGFVRKSAGTLGNFWVDLTRGTLYILLPLSLVLALALVSQGVVQTLRPSAHVALVEPLAGPGGAAIGDQTLALGPAASQVAIKQLGTNGGGFFNANSAHPFENATPLADFLEVLAILLIPAALCYAFGRMVRDTRQGWAVLAAMTLLFVALLVPAAVFEGRGNPRLAALGVDQVAGPLQPGGNMEGKEVRFGIAGSARWATVTTAASNGSVNAMHDSFTPLGGLVPLWLMQLGEVVFGGAGSGLYGMLMLAVVAVFVAGLMVGRTPEYLGKKIEAYEMKMASLAILAPNAVLLLGTAVAVATAAGRAGVLNPGPHGFTEILYAFSSASNNNGSAFAGLSANTPFYNVALGTAMVVGRYWIIVPVLALAGSLSRKKLVPPGEGTLETHTPLFVGLLIGTVVLIGALTHLPGLALGPIVEHLMAAGR